MLRLLRVNVLNSGFFFKSLFISANTIIDNISIFDFVSRNTPNFMGNPKT